MVVLCALCLLDCDCCVRPGDTEISRSLLKRQAIGQRIDLEKKAALGNAHILDDGKLNNAAADSGGDVDHIGIDRTVARCRVSVAFVEGIKRERDSDGDDGNCDQSATKRSAGFAGGLHLSVPEADEPDQKSRDHADRGANGELIGHCIGKAAAYKGGACDDSACNSDYAAQQPSWEECTEQIERGRAARGTPAERIRHKKNEATC